MKKIFLAVLVCFSYFSNAQTMSYNDIGVLFSQENINGTARFNAMSGAFGALGGDLSSIESNPAGAAVFINSEFSVSLNIRNTDIDAGFYGTNLTTENDATNLSQAGGVLVFKGNNRNSGWNRFVVGFNYSMANDFENMWAAKGNSSYAPITDYYDPDVVYLNSDGQYFENINDGQNNKYTFTLASQYNNNLYLGASITTYDINNYQRVLIEEYNNDGEGNTLDVSQIQELATYGDGISFNIGFIAKATDNLRLGLAYQSPVWYSLSEDYLEYDVEINESIYSNIDTDFSGTTSFDYNLRTPSKLTGSLAYIFEKNGLISLDYIFKNYSNIKLTNANFSDENNAFKANLENSGELRLGTEWRFKAISLRGGYHFEKNPYKTSINSDNIEGFSFGAGIKFRGGKIDLSYQKDNNTAPYSFYPDSNQVSPAELDIDNSKFTATLVLNI